MGFIRIKTHFSGRSFATLRYMIHVNNKMDSKYNCLEIVSIKKSKASELSLYNLCSLIEQYLII